MVSMERKHEICSPFNPRCNPLRKTSAEIVSEARQFLRVQSTQRPLTPRDGQRQLFGKSSVRADHPNRPPSTFSLHFDAPDSRPGSGTRLSPLEHKPTLPVTFDAGDAFKAFPKPPTDPLEVKRGLRRAGSLTRLPPVAVQTDVREGSNPGPGLKQLSARSLPPDQAEVRGSRRAASESRASLLRVDSGPTEASAGRRTVRTSGPGTAEQDAGSSPWDGRVAALLRQLESEAAGGSGGSAERLCDLCDGLHAALTEADLLGRRCRGRPRILRTLFRLVDVKSAPLNLLIARLCLALCVSGNNLLNICKLVFQISRSESNDVLFQNTSILDSLLDVLSREEAPASGEALLYCVGTLKFLSGSAAILSLLLDKNVLGAARTLLQRLQAVEEPHGAAAGHVLVQLTATLRNLADHPASRPLFVSFSILPELCVVLRRHGNDQDICTNISRIFSKLSSYSECRLALAQTPDCYPLFLELLDKHPQNQDLVVRLLFTLGNLTAKTDASRLQLFQCGGCCDTLLRLYSSYQPWPEGTRDDVLVKLLRLLANMCIHPAVGRALASSDACIRLLLETLDLRSVHGSEELLVNAAAAINNLSFYQEEAPAVRRRQLRVAQSMMKLVLSSSPDARLEATRVYGNLSRSKDVRDFIMQNQVYQFMVALLDSKNPDMCFSACGVLTNLALDAPNRVRLSLEGAAAKLADCLRDLGPGDWQLAGQLCQAAWNLIGGGSEKLLDAQERESLLETLSAFLDKEEALKWIENEDLRDFHRACWELEFQPVAQKLMKTLQLQV